jgi:hypothetical protein
MREVRNAFKILVRKPEWKKLLARLGIDGRRIINWVQMK